MFFQLVFGSSVCCRSFPYLHCYAVIIQLFPKELLSFSFHFACDIMMNEKECNLSSSQGFSTLSAQLATLVARVKRKARRKNQLKKGNSKMCLHSASNKDFYQEMFIALWTRKSFPRDLTHFIVTFHRHHSKIGCFNNKLKWRMR